VKGGLSPGERVVINGLQRVRPGMKVNATLAAMTPDTTGKTVATAH
jgi:multidrug efflux system membrane fusion protein